MLPPLRRAGLTAALSLQSLVYIAGNILPVPGKPGVRSNPGGNPVLYSPYLFGIGRHAIMADDVSQVLDLWLQKSAFRGF